LKLAGADPVLVAADQVDRLKPEAERDLARLEYRPHADGERLRASIALVEPCAGGGAFQLADPIAAFAVVADGAMRPKARFHIGESGFFIVEVKV
jgi:hypothetical protein